MLICANCARVSVPLMSRLPPEPTTVPVFTRGAAAARRFAGTCAPSANRDRQTVISSSKAAGCLAFQGIRQHLHGICAGHGAVYTMGTSNPSTRPDCSVAVVSMCHCHGAPSGGAMELVSRPRVRTRTAEASAMVVRMTRSRPASAAAVTVLMASYAQWCFATSS